MFKSQKSQLWQRHNVQVSEVSTVQVADRRSGPKSAKTTRNGYRIVARSLESVPVLLPAISSPLGPVPRPKTAKIEPKLPINRPPAAAMLSSLVAMVDSIHDNESELNNKMQLAKDASDALGRAEKAAAALKDARTI